VKPNLLIDPALGFAPAGAEIEGLIHTARCPKDNSIELLTPVVDGREWPGGLSSPLMKTSVLEERRHARSVFRSSRPLGSRGASQFLAPSVLCVKTVFPQKKNFFCGLFVPKFVRI
jgi:hypothetical protein